ncbi:MAG: tetratricopeptide repeat protein [Verrucomicrobiota bacterium]
MRAKVARGLAVAALVAAITAAYANHFQNSFHFDDAHTIVNNAGIQDLRNIPLFFRDATTFSSLPSNQSYRPLVSTLVAIDYHLGGGLHPLSFHLSIFALFVALILLLAFVIDRVLNATAISDHNGWIALAAAAWYGLHPANADTVNYIIASADVLSTLGVVASFALYLGFPDLRRYYIYVLPAAVAILAKPPAAIFAVLFAIYRLLFPSDDARERPMSGCMAEMAPPFLICVVMLWFVQYMTPRTWVGGSANAHNYLITQPYVALLYLKTFLWPSSLSADYDLNPFATTHDPRFWTGVAFAVLFTATAIAAAFFKKTRLIGFGLLWFLIALLPTSLLPLAEVMNDHRTFLPYVGLVIAMAGAAARLVNRRATYGLPVKITMVSVTALFLCANGYATFQRNNVWKTEETLWHDVTIKSPQNGRGLMNYGNTLMAKGDYAGALDYFHRALVFTPQYSVLFINLAIAEGATKKDTVAEQHFKEALRLAPSTPDSYTYYARYLLSRSRGHEARELLRNALELSPTDLTARGLLAQTDEQSRNPLPAPTAESYLNLSLARYGQGRFDESIESSRKALELRPDYAEAWNNICAACNKLGRYNEAAAACEEALRYKPDFELARSNLQYAREMAKAPAK